MYKTHELAGLLPAMSTDDYKRLRDDIAANGLLEPIVLHEDRVLDGVHRQKACKETGTPPVYEPFTGDDPARFVFSANVARRHLTVGQLAMVAAELTSRTASHGGDRKSGVAKSSSDSNLTVKQAADLAGVAAGTVSAARRVSKERPDLAKEVKAGKTTLNAAVEEMTGKHTGGNGGRRQKNWNGKTNPTRQRELKAKAKTGNYNDLLRLSLRMNEACNIIEAYHVEDFDLDAATLAVIDTFHDDLITLAHWSDRAITATQGWLGSVAVRDKIAALRQKTVANGATKEESDSAHKLADKLERKLEAGLPAGV